MDSISTDNRITQQTERAKIDKAPTMTEQHRDEGQYAKHVQIHRCKRKTWHEKLGERVLV